MRNYSLLANPIQSQVKTPSDTRRQSTTLKAMKDLSQRRNRPAGKALLVRVPTHEEMLERLRTSLHAATPSPPGGYRDSPPSSSASSCGQSSDPDDAIDYDYDDTSIVVDTIEWQGWIDWDRVTRPPTNLPLIESMRIDS